jgi:predicted transcriptional regulator
MSDDPMVQRRRLQLELRERRRRSGRTQRDIAEAMDWSLAKTIRIENGEVAISANDLRALLSYLGEVDERRIESLVEMAKASRGVSWSDMKDLFSTADLTYLRLEHAASLIRSFQNVVVPGLLQTDDYARAILVEIEAHQDQDVERLRQARQRRQELHRLSHPPEMFFVLDESVVRRVVGGATVMRGQLEKLRYWSDLDHVHVQVMPFSAGAFPGIWAPYSLLEFPDPKDDDLLYEERPTSSATTRDDPELTGRYLERFFVLEQRALPEKATIELLDELIAETPADDGKDS